LNKFSDLSAFINCHEDLDAIFISETWLKCDKQQPNSLFPSLGKYNIFRSNRILRGHGGVAALIRPELNPVELEAVSFRGLCECLWISISNKSSKITLGLIYRSQSSDEQSDKSLLESIEKYSKLKSDLVLVGDFNLPGAFNGPTEQTARFANFTDLFADYGLVQLVDFPTRQSNTLDLLLTNDHLLVSNVKSEPPFANSDHDSFCFSINFDPEPLPFKPTPNFYKGRYDEMQDFLTSVDWDNLLGSDDSPESMWETFSNVIDYAIHLFVPLKTNNDTVKRSPADTKRAFCQKRKFYRKHFRSHNSTHKARSRAEGRLHRRLCRRDKFDEENRILNANDKRKFFKFVGSKLTSKDRIPPLNSPDGSTHSARSTKAEILNDQFSSVFTEDDNKLPEFPSRTRARLETIPITENIVLKQRKKLGFIAQRFSAVLG
jgi:hypothetical protein